MASSKNKILLYSKVFKQKILGIKPYILLNNGSNNLIDIHKNSQLINTSLKIVGSNNKICIDANCFFNNVLIQITGNNNEINIAEGVRFNKGGELWIEDDNCLLSIGDNSTFEETHLAVTEPNSKIIIGNNCMFSNDIDVRTGDSHSILDLQTQQRINYAKNVTLGNNVWVGAHTSILKGVTLQDDTIVATRSLVTKPFQQKNIIVGGSPATILKENVLWKRERIYNR